MVQDIQDWIDGTEGNYGWLLVGDEDANAPTITARRFASGDSTTNNTAHLPKLFVQYTAPLVIQEVGELCLTDVKDSTMYSASGDLSNGAGKSLWSGRSSNASFKRSALRFNTFSIPSGATITSAVLRLQVDRMPFGQPSPTQVDLHRLLKNWGEEATDAANSPECLPFCDEGGRGVQAFTNDMTSTHSFYPSSLWDTAGGDFAASSATAQVPMPNAGVEWSSAGMVADIQAWVDGTAVNYGWLLVGDEGGPNITARRYVSSDSTTNASHFPKLIVGYFTETPNCGNPSAIYVNSANVTDDPMENTPMSLNPTGADHWLWGRALNGQSDDFAIFKEALTCDEIVVINGITTTTTSTTTSSTSTTSTTSTTTSTTTFCDVVEYMEPFESYPDGWPMQTTPGWKGFDGTANVTNDSALIVKLVTYTNAGLDFPITNAMHEKFLCVNRFEEISTCISGTDSTLFVDFIWLPGATATIGSTAEAGANDQLVMYVDGPTRRLRIWHDDTGSPEFLTLANAPTISSNEFSRITIELNYTGNRYRVRVNQGAEVSDARGWNSPTGGSQPGAWFNMVQKNGFLSRFFATSSGDTSYIDDLQVKLSNPVMTPLDLWLEQFNLPPGQSGSNDDPDGDGLDNFGEWITGTDPNDPNDVFEICDVDFLSGSNCVWWRVGTNTEITTPFMLWRATNLMDLLYEEIADGIPRDPSGTNVYYDTNPPAGPAVYRAVLPTNHP